MHPRNPASQEPSEHMACSWRRAEPSSFALTTCKVQAVWYVSSSVTERVTGNRGRQPGIWKTCRGRSSHMHCVMCPDATGYRTGPGFIYDS